MFQIKVQRNLIAGMDMEGYPRNLNPPPIILGDGFEHDSADFQPPERSQHSKGHNVAFDFRHVINMENLQSAGKRGRHLAAPVYYK